MMMNKVTMKMKALFLWRRIKVKFTKYKYIRPDDIRRIGKTTYMIRKAFKSNKPVIIIAPLERYAVFIREMVEKLRNTEEGNLQQVTVLSLHDVIFLARVNRLRLLEENTIFLEEGLDEYDVRDLYYNIGSELADEIKLSYSEYLK